MPLAAALFFFAVCAVAQTNQGASKPPGPAAAHAPKAAAALGQPAPRFVACHALEKHASAQPSVTIVVFNQRDKPDHQRLSDLLKENDGSGVELRTSDGKWHKATVARLKSCFGRGLLFLSGDVEQLKDRDDFLLRFPPKAAS